MSDAAADVPMPELSDDQLMAVVEAHDLDVLQSAIHQLNGPGVVNSVWSLGERLVLRVTKPSESSIAETRRESVAVPAVRAAGVRTPELVVFDDTRTITDGPYTVYDRVVGSNLGDTPWGPDAKPHFREIGRQLATLHAGVTSVADPDCYLQEVTTVDALSVLADRAAAGYVAPDQRAWLEASLERCRSEFADAPTSRSFLHNDLHPTNVLVSTDGAVLLDWGEASWGDSSIDFDDVPTRALPIVLAGYREVALPGRDISTEARILWNQFAHALASLAQERPEKTLAWLWSAGPSRRLLELLAFAADAPKPWRQLLAG